MRVFGWTVLIVIALIVLWAGMFAAGWVGRAVDVVQQQVDPFELQRKYELFKDEAAQLDKKLADIRVYEGRFKKFNCHAEKMDRTTREQCMVWDQEVAGIIASYNGLAAEYNAQMAKWNYAFTNVGQLPKGASVPLPREFKPYQYE